MKVLKSLPLLLLLLLSVGCATQRSLLSPRAEVIDEPPLNKERRVELGDTVLAKGEVHTYEGFDLKNQLTGGDGLFLKKLVLDPGPLILRHADKKWRYYYSDHFSVYDSILGTSFQPGGLKISQQDANNYVLFMGHNLTGFSPKQTPELIPQKIYDLDRPSFRQELIYNGRSGNSVKFLYREFSNEFLRGNLNQEIQYDLAESKVIGFKGARLEIIEADNAFLRYKPILNFTPAEALP